MKRIILSICLILFLTVQVNSVEKMLENVKFANCYNSINEAVNSLGAGGGTVYIPPGIYTIDSTIHLKSNISLIGSGIGITILKAKANINDDMIQNYHTASQTYVDSNILISNLTLDGNRANQGDETVYNYFGILMPGYQSYQSMPVKNVIIENVEVKEFKEQGITICGENITIKNCIITNCKWDNLQVSGHNIIVSGSTFDSCSNDNVVEVSFADKVVVSNCTATRAKNAGFLIRNSRNVTIDNCIANKNNFGFWIWSLGMEYDETVKGVSITNCIADSNNVGFRIRGENTNKKDAENFTLTGNIASYNNYEGLYIWRCQNVLLQGNLAYNNYRVAGDYNTGIRTVESKNITFLGNKSYDNRDSKYQSWGYREIGSNTDSNQVLWNEFKENLIGDYNLATQKFYNLSFWYKTTDSSNCRMTNLSQEYYPNGIYNFSIPAESLDGGWHKFSSWLNSPWIYLNILQNGLPATLTWGFQPGYGGHQGDSMWIDDILLTESSVIANGDFEEGNFNSWDNSLGNLLSNSDFETGDFTSWDSSTNCPDSALYIDSGIKHSGSYSARITLKCETGSIWLQRPFIPDTNYSYTVSFYYKSNGDIPNNRVTGLSQTLYTNGIYTMLIPIDSLDNTWRKFTGSFDTHGADDTIWFTWGFQPGYGGEIGDSMWIDDIVLTKDCSEGSDIVIDTTTKYNGFYAAKINYRCDNPAVWLKTSFVNPDSGRSYEFELYYKTTDSLKIKILSDPNDDTTFYAGFVDTLDGNWHEKTISFTNTANDSILFDIGFDGDSGGYVGDSAFIDNVNLLSNFIINGDFETGDLTGWDSTGGGCGGNPSISVSSSVKHSGSYSGKINLRCASPEAIWLYQTYTPSNLSSPSLFMGRNPNNTIIMSGQLQIPYGIVNPNSPTSGQIFFNTTGDTLYLYNGSQWRAIPTQ